MNDLKKLKKLLENKQLSADVKKDIQKKIKLLENKQIVEK